MKKSPHKFTKRPPSAKATKKTHIAEANKKRFIAEANKRKSASDANDEVDLLEETQARLSSKTSEKVPIAATLDKGDSGQTVKKVPSLEAVKSTSILERLKGVSVPNFMSKVTIPVRFKKVSVPDLIAKVAIPECIKNISISEFVKKVAISESIKKAPVAESGESTPETAAAAPGDSISEPVESTPVSAAVPGDSVSEPVETPPVTGAVLSESIPGAVEQLSLIERIKQISSPELIRKITVSERWKIVGITSVAKRVLFPKSFQQVSISGFIDKLPIVERTKKSSISGLIKTIPVPERIKEIPVPEFVKKIPGVEFIRTVPISEIPKKLAAVEYNNQDAALFIRVGMGLLFIIGGCSKLSKLLHPNYAEGIVNSYVGTTGYINELFLSYLFPINSPLSPWGFLTALSTFELVSGIALIAGLMVRPLALIYAFLLWTFVFSLPVVTTPGVELAISTYTSPAMFVQARDIALSGLMFVLYQLGSGRRSLDSLFVVNATQSSQKNWDSLGLLLRLSIALPLLIGALFGSFGNIMTFSTTSWILLVVAVLLICGIKVREAAAVTMLIMFWYVMTKLTLDKSFIGNLNGFKRELALFAGALVLFGRGGGNSYTPADFVRRIRTGLGKVYPAPIEAI